MITPCWWFVSAASRRSEFTRRFPASEGHIGGQSPGAGRDHIDGANDIGLSGVETSDAVGAAVLEIVDVELDIDIPSSNPAARNVEANKEVCGIAR